MLLSGIPFHAAPLLLAVVFCTLSTAENATALSSSGVHDAAATIVETTVKTAAEAPAPLHCDAAACPAVPKHYAELGCTGIPLDGGCCPQRFECPDVKNYPLDQCMFRGRAYADGEPLADKLAAECSAGCRCQSIGGKTSFQCAQIECPEHLGVPPKAGCVPQRSLSSCCSHAEVCGDEVKKLSECYADGVRYVQGDIIYPAAAPCHKCLCDAAWTNATRPAENANCRTVDCGIELRSLARIRSGCVPVYFGTKSCCPIEYRCPQDTDEVLPFDGRSESSAIDAKMLCTFDDLKLQLGQQLKPDDKCVECTCRNPPMLDCVRIPNC